MVMLECSCGYSCGTREAFLRHMAHPRDLQVAHYLVAETRTRLELGPAGDLGAVEARAELPPAPRGAPPQQPLCGSRPAPAAADQPCSRFSPPHRGSPSRVAVASEGLTGARPCPLRRPSGQGRPGVSAPRARSTGSLTAPKATVGEIRQRVEEWRPVDRILENFGEWWQTAIECPMVREQPGGGRETRRPAGGQPEKEPPKAAGDPALLAPAAKKLRGPLWGAPAREPPKAELEHNRRPPPTPTRALAAAAIAPAASRGGCVRQGPGFSPGCAAVGAAGARERARARTLPPGAGVAPATVGELLARFASADSAERTLGALEGLQRHAGVCSAAGTPFEALREHCGGGAPWKARAIWDMLHARRSRPEYQAAPLAGRPVVVCGAGPCGLRAALEMALLGASVTVIEKRGLADACGRINRVHLWEWCKQDLVQWGAKLFDPPGGAFGRDNDFCHIGIGELQLLLLKNALLLGVDVRFGAEALAVEQGELACACGARLPCWSLVLSSGASSPISHAVGLNPVVVGLRGKGSAIGVVANFANSQEADQMALRQFSWARQFNAPLFRRITEEVSVDLENVVYYKGARHHYMVMTPTKASLIGAGVLRDGQPAGGELLCGGNVDAGRLRELTSSVAAFFGLPADALLEGPQGATIFDFSGVRRLESPTAMASGVLVCAVGDALLEPFWPEGLGILRGFMSALDAASALALGAQEGHSAAVAQLAATFTVLKSVAAQTAAQCLQKDPSQYRLAPSTRYAASQL